MGTELVKHVDVIKEMSALEVAWSDLPPVRKPDDFESTRERIEDGYVSNRYVSLVLVSLATLSATSVAFMTGFNSVEDMVGTVITAIAVPVGSIIAELALENKKSLFGMLDTRILRRKKYRVLYSKEQLEYADSVNRCNQKRSKLEKKLLLEAERISSETEGMMVFSNGKFSPKKVQPVLSSREKELLNQFTKQLSLES